MRTDNVLFCPFCLTIFLDTQEEGDECPECQIGILEYKADYDARVEKLDEEDVDKKYE